MIFRLILPNWAADEFPERRRVLEGEFTPEQLEKLNEQYYNVYYLPNHPSIYDGSTVDGSKIDVFNYVFVDCDLKDGVYATKEDFIGSLDIIPTRLVDSGGGIHAYWRVTDLDVMSYLKLCRRLMRNYKTDEAVGQLYQLLRYPGYLNTKDPNNFRLCELIYEDPSVTYTAEKLDNLLPPLSKEDEQHCLQHYDKTTNAEARRSAVTDKMPDRWGHFLRECQEAKEIWCGKTDDRSKGDYRLGHLMFAHGFSKEEAASVLVNSAKALERAPVHRINYATNIIDKIWTFENPTQESAGLKSQSVAAILERGEEQLKGDRYATYPYFDATHHGFRLGQVLGLVAGSGVGKTAISLNCAIGFLEKNPDLDILLVPLEQPVGEIALRIKKICGGDERLFSKIQLMSNYREDGTFEHYSLDDIKEYVLNYHEKTGRRFGLVMIDHIGALRMKGKEGENQGLIDICHGLKAFAVTTNTLLFIQSQSNREKAGIGDIELNKDAAYGTVFFEAYCDYLITIWQPLKRVYDAGAPTVTAFKFCKIRHKNPQDTIKEDVRYLLMFDATTERMRPLTQVEEKAFTYHNSAATNKRKADRKTDVLEYKSVTWITTEGGSDGKADHHQDSGAAGSAPRLPH